MVFVIYYFGNYSNLYLQIIILLYKYIMNKFSLLVVGLLLSLSICQSYDGVFAFSWLAGHCQYQLQNHKQACDPSLINLWDNQSFTIHGIWPNTNSTTTYGAFNLKYFEKNLRLFDDMQNYWPPKSKPSTTNVFLWQHEWDTHGKDYANIILKLRPDEFAGTIQERNEKLQIAFFTQSINFYKSFKVKKLPSGNFTKTQFANLLGLSQSQFILVCLKGNQVREVQVCFQTTKSGNQIKDCTKSTSTCTNGGQTIELISYALKKQQRVFDYPKYMMIDSS